MSGEMRSNDLGVEVLIVIGLLSDIWGCGTPLLLLATGTGFLWKAVVSWTSRRPPNPNLSVTSFSNALISSDKGPGHVY